MSTKFYETVAEAAAKAAQPDKLRFTFRGMIPTEVDLTWGNKIRKMVRDELGWSEEYARKHVETHLAISSAQKNGPVTTLQVTFRAARYYALFPTSIWTHLTELEAKVYLDEMSDAQYDNFVSDLDTADHGLMTRIYRTTNKGAAHRKSRHRYLALGSSKADFGGVVYMRNDERPGIEAHIRGAACIKAGNEARVILAYAAGDKPGLVPELYVNRAAYAAYVRLFKNLEKGDIQLSAYATHFHNYENGAEEWEGLAAPVSEVIPVFSPQGDMFDEEMMNTLSLIADHGDDDQIEEAMREGAIIEEVNGAAIIDTSHLPPSSERPSKRRKPSE